MFCFTWSKKSTYNTIALLEIWPPGSATCLLIYLYCFCLSIDNRSESMKWREMKGNVELLDMCMCIVFGNVSCDEQPLMDRAQNVPTPINVNTLDSAIRTWTVMFRDLFKIIQRTSLTSQLEISLFPTNSSLWAWVLPLQRLRPIVSLCPIKRRLKYKTTKAKSWRKSKDWSPPAHIGRGTACVHNVEETNLRLLGLVVATRLTSPSVGESPSQEQCTLWYTQLTDGSNPDSRGHF